MRNGLALSHSGRWMVTLGINNLLTSNPPRIFVKCLVADMTSGFLSPEKTCFLYFQFVDSLIV
jgi:hypothetical protein